MSFKKKKKLRISVCILQNDSIDFDRASLKKQLSISNSFHLNQRLLVQTCDVDKMLDPPNRIVFYRWFGSTYVSEVDNKNIDQIQRWNTQNLEKR